MFVPCRILWPNLRFPPSIFFLVYLYYSCISSMLGQGARAYQTFGFHTYRRMLDDLHNPWQLCWMSIPHSITSNIANFSDPLISSNILFLSTIFLQCQGRSLLKIGILRNPSSSKAPSKRWELGRVVAATCRVV